MVLGVGDDDPSAMVGPCGEWVHDDWEAPMRACDVAMIALALPMCVILSTLFFFPLSRSLGRWNVAARLRRNRPTTNLDLRLVAMRKRRQLLDCSFPFFFSWWCRLLDRFHTPASLFFVSLLGFRIEPEPKSSFGLPERPNVQFVDMVNKQRFGGKVRGAVYVRQVVIRITFCCR